MIAGASSSTTEKLPKQKALGEAITNLEKRLAQAHNPNNTQDIEIDMALEVANLYQLTEIAEKAGYPEAHFDLGIFFLNYTHNYIHENLTDDALNEFTKVPQGSVKYDNAQEVLTTFYFGQGTQSNKNAFYDLALSHAIKIKAVASKNKPIQKLAQNMEVSLEERAEKIMIGTQAVKKIPDDIIPIEFIACVSPEAKISDLKMAFKFFKEMAIFEQARTLQQATEANQPLIFSAAKRQKRESNNQGMTEENVRPPSPPNLL